MCQIKQQLMQKGVISMMDTVSIYNLQIALLTARFHSDFVQKDIYHKQGFTKENNSCLKTSIIDKWKGSQFASNTLFQ